MTLVRGEVWLFDLGMAEKVRPALVVSVAFGDADRALVTIVPHTTRRISIRDSSQRLVLEGGRVRGARRVNVSARESHTKAGGAQAGPVPFGVRRCPAMAWSRSSLHAIDHV